MIVESDLCFNFSCSSVTAQTHSDFRANSFVTCSGATVPTFSFADLQCFTIEPVDPVYERIIEVLTNRKRINLLRKSVFQKPVMPAALMVRPMTFNKFNKESNKR